MSEPDFALLALAYGLGSLPFGVWVGRLAIGRDIRAGGSGHSGATNTMRQAGWAAGALVAALDVTKGFAAAWLALRLGANPWLPALAAAAAVAGHCWPVFAGFRGGMGIGTGGGALLALNPLAAALGLRLVAAGTLILRHSARGNVLAGLLVGPVLWLVLRDPVAALAGLGAGLILVGRSLADWNRRYRELWLDRPAAGPGPRGGAAS